MYFYKFFFFIRKEPILHTHFLQSYPAFLLLVLLVFSVYADALFLTLTLMNMNKKIHETRLSSGNFAYRSPAFWFSRTQMRQQHRSIQIQRLLQHIVFIPKPLTVFMIFSPFLFSYQLSRYIITLYHICQPFLIISVIVRHFRFPKCLSVNRNLFLTCFFTSFLTNTDRTFTIRYRTDG